MSAPDGRGTCGYANPARHTCTDTACPCPCHTDGSPAHLLRGEAEYRAETGWPVYGAWFATDDGARALGAGGAR